MRRTLLALGWSAALIALVTAILLAGVGIAAFIGSSATESTWRRWGDAGQAFGSINTVFSGLAFVALVVTFLMQLQELRMQRAEICMQRDALTKSHNELRRSADADIRALHVKLIEMSMNDPVLAAVWPDPEPGLSDDRRRQYLYVNLIIQHLALAQKHTNFTEDEVRTAIRHLFSSPIVRGYWLATARDRHTLVIPDTDEEQMTRIADDVFREFADLPP